MPRPAPLPDGIEPTAFAIGTAAQAGVSISRLRASDLSIPFRGVRTQTPPVTFEDWARAYLPRMPRSGRYTHTTAAQLLGLRMPEGFHETVLHVGVARPARAPRIEHVVGHQVAADAPTFSHRGLIVTPPIAAWVQCAALLHVDDLIVMGDGLVRRTTPWATMQQLREAVTAAAGSRGFARLAAALPWIRPRSDSARETMLRLLIVRAGFSEPEVNGPIVNRYGAVIAHGDLVYRDARVIVEYDGEGHLTARQRAIDLRRLDEIREEGWWIIQVDKQLMAARATLLGKLQTALSR